MANIWGPIHANEAISGQHRRRVGHLLREIWFCQRRGLAGLGGWSGQAGPVGDGGGLDGFVETYCVAMATDEHGEQFGLTFQVPLSGEYDDQDRRLGMDTYSISDHLGQTIYGGILAIAADSGASALTMTFSVEVADTLNIPETLIFHLPEGKFDEVVEGLRRVFAGDELGGSLR